MVSLDIRADIKSVHEALKEVDISFRKVHKRILSALTIQMRNRVTKQIYKSVKKDTGELKASIYKWSKSDRTGVVSTRKQYIAQTLEFGKRIVPRKNARIVGKKTVLRYLTFKGKDGVWHKVREVNIRPHPFFFSPIEQYVNSPEFEKTINAVCEKILKKAGLETK